MLNELELVERMLERLPESKRQKVIERADKILKDTNNDKEQWARWMESGSFNMLSSIKYTVKLNEDGTPKEHPSVSDFTNGTMNTELMMSPGVSERLEPKERVLAFVAWMTAVTVSQILFVELLGLDPTAFLMMVLKRVAPDIDGKMMDGIQDEGEKYVPPFLRDKKTQREKEKSTQQIMYG